VTLYASIDRARFLKWRHTFNMGAMTSIHVRPPLAATFDGCPLAYRARMSSVHHPQYLFFNFVQRISETVQDKTIVKMTD